MNKIYLFALVFLLINSVSAFDFKIDNVAKYSEDVKIATIQDTFLGIPTSNLGTVELKTPFYNIVPPSSKARVMRVQLDSLDFYENGIGNLEVKNVNENNKTIYKEFTYEFVTLEDYEVLDYDLSCTIAKNGTRVCEQIQIGSHMEQKEVSNPIKDYNLPKGLVTIDIYTEMKIGDVIDIIPEFYGQKLSRWAISATDTLLHSYYNFDNSTGTTAYDMVSPKQDLTVTNSWTQYGKINNGLNITTGGSVNSGFSLSGTSAGWTMNAWVYRNGSFVSGPASTLAGVGNDNPTVDGDWRYTSGNCADQTTQLGLDIHDGTSRQGIGVCSDFPLNRWQMVTLVLNSTNASIYLNGTLNKTYALVTFTPNANNLKFFATGADTNTLKNSYVDEIGIWNRTLTQSEINVLYNNYIGFAYPFLLISNVNITNPINNTGFTSLTGQTFNATATLPSSSIINATRYLYYSNGTFISTNFTGLTNIFAGNKTNFTVPSLPQGSYLVNIQMCESGGYCAFGTNTTFTLDSTSPIMNISYPVGVINGLTNGQSLVLNFSVSDSNLGTCWRSYNGVNTTMSCTSNSSFTYAQGINNLTIYANDTVGNVGSAFTSWMAGIVVDAIAYNSSTYETSYEGYVINYSSSNIISSNALFYYNGTSYSSIVSCSSGNCTARNNLDVPLISSGNQQNMSFYWVISSYNGSGVLTFTSSVSNQAVNLINVTYSANYSNCVTAMNFTAFDEQNRTRISPFDFQGNFQYYIGLGTKYRVLNISNSSATSVFLCINRNTTMNLDAIIAYSAPSEATPYILRNYFFQRHPISNNSQNVPLYLLKSSSSTSFVLQVQDRFVLPVPQVLVDVQKCYSGLNQNETVFVARTDSNGLTTGNFEAETALYQFFIKNYSNVLLSVTPCSAVVPQTVPYTLLFQLGSGYISPFVRIDNVTNVTSNLSYNYQSNILTWTYEDISNNFSYANLTVRSLNYSGSNQPIVCTSVNTLSAGVITCNVSNAGSYVATGYIYRISQILTDQTIFTVQTFSSTVGYYGVFLGMFLIIISAFAFKFNEIAGIVLINAVVILCNFFGLIAFGKVFVTSFILVSILIIGVLER